MRVFSGILCLFAVLAFTACDGPKVSLAPNTAADPLVPEYGPLPWPSDRWLVEDPDTLTGYRLNYVEGSIPLNKDGEPFDLAPYNRFDGFSAASQILTVFTDPPNLTGMPLHDNIGLSLEADSPTVILNLKTGERVAHWVELDAQSDDLTQQTFILRPATRLDENTSYGIALRGLKTAAGTDIPRSKAFQALVDGALTDNELFETRRESYDELLFPKLEEAGIAREELTLAWWFHTSSDQSIQGDLLAMLEDALPRLTSENITCTVTEVREPYDDNMVRRIDGTFTVPLYVNSGVAPQSSAEDLIHVVRDDNGRPMFNGWYEAPLSVMIPNVLNTDPANPTPGNLLQFGHGLMGQGRDEGMGGYLRGLSNELGFVVAATDWEGMSELDVYSVTRALANITNFYHVTERLMQGMVNQVVLTKALTELCRDVPELQLNGTYMIAEEDPYYLGISQGGIFGATLMTVNPFIERGVLNVGGMSYPLMIDRSVDFYGTHDDQGYAFIMDAWYGKRIEKFFGIHFMQHQWDLADPSGWMHRMLDGGLAGDTPKKILYQVAANDAQVPNLSSDLAGRTAGLKTIKGSTVEPWGLEVIDLATDPQPANGSGFMYFDTGDPVVPFENLPPDDDYGSHGAVRHTDSAKSQMLNFFRPDGTVTMPCDGVCDPD